MVDLVQLCYGFVLSFCDIRKSIHDCPIFHSFIFHFEIAIFWWICSFKRRRQKLVSPVWPNWSVYIKFDSGRQERIMQLLTQRNCIILNIICESLIFDISMVLLYNIQGLSAVSRGFAWLSPKIFLPSTISEPLYRILFRIRHKNYVLYLRRLLWRRKFNDLNYPPIAHISGFAT